MTKGGWLYGVFHDQDPDRCRYGGITTRSIKERAYQHWYFALHPSSKTTYGPMPSWLRKHRDERDQIQFVELGWFETLEELKAAEIEFIRQGRLRGECDLNLTDGGEGGNGWKHTEESKRKLSAAFSGSKNPMYGRDRRELMLYASGFRGPVTQAMKENLSRKMVAWWDDRPERRLEYSQRVSEAWKSGRMTAATRET